MSNEGPKNSPKPKLFEAHPNLSDEINKNIMDSELEGELYLKKIPVGKSIKVTTRNSEYIITRIKEPTFLDFTIVGHPRYCPVPTECNIHGSNWGGSMLKIDFISRGMYMEFSTAEHYNISTSLVMKIEEV